VIEIEATDSDPNEAARLANAVANSYRSYRAAQRRQSLASDLDSLEKRFAEQEGKIRKASDEVDRLRLQVDVSDPAIAPAVYYDNPPPVLLSAETLRRIEALRIETQADYLKQKTLLTRLENMGPAELPETLQAAGCADSQLANNVEMLGIVEQKLVSLRQEYGPEHPEMLKIKAQEKDLKDRILERTEGILRGLQAKLEATREGILSLSNAVLEAQRVDVQKSTRNQRYLEAVRDLQELQRFRSILEAKISLERNETGLPGEPVEILAEASPPAAVLAPDRRRAAGLFVSGCGLVLIGCLAIRLGGTSEPSVSE
jgi:uncharacterized protein involved in exopolysaccharide biosynthesis